MADDHAPAPATPFDVETDEGLEAHLDDLHGRRGVPERLRYPETDEAYDRMIAEAEAGGEIPAEEVEAWIRSLSTAHPSARPRAR